MENAKKNLVFHFGVGRQASSFQIGYVKSKLQIGTDFKGVSKLSKYFYCLAALVSFISKFQEFSTTYYCWSLHRFQTYLNYHFYEELGMNNLHILFSGDEITYVPNILFSDVYNIYIHSGLKYRTHSFILQIFWKKNLHPLKFNQIPLKSKSLNSFAVWLLER